MPITFETDAQRAVYEKVAGYMRELFGEMAMARDDVPVFDLQHGSAYTLTAVVPWGDDAIIVTSSYVVTGAELTLELAQYLLRENWDMRLGAFGVEQGGDIIFQHAVVGSACDKKELQASVLAVAYIADEYDDKIIERWGGQRATDQPS